MSQYFNTKFFLFNIMSKIAIDITDAIREFVKNEDNEYKFIYTSIHRHSVGMRDNYHTTSIIKKNNTDTDIEVDDNGMNNIISELAVINFNIAENTITFRITDKEFCDKFDIDDKKSYKSILRKYYLTDRLCAGTIFGELNKFYPKSYVDLLAKFDSIINTNVECIYNALDKYNVVHSDEEDVDLL